MEKTLKKYKLIRELDYLVHLNKNSILNLISDKTEFGEFNVISNLANSFKKDSPEFIGTLSDDRFIIKRNRNFKEFSPSNSIVKCLLTECGESSTKLKVKIYGFESSRLLYLLGPFLVLLCVLLVSIIAYGFSIIYSFLLLFFGFIMFIVFPYKMTLVDLDNTERMLTETIDKLNKNDLQQYLL